MAGPMSQKRDMGHPAPGFRRAIGGVFGGVEILLDSTFVGADGGLFRGLCTWFQQGCGAVSCWQGWTCTDFPEYARKCAVVFRPIFPVALRCGGS